MFKFKLVLVLLLSTLVMSVAQADEYRPAYLEIKQVNESRFDVLWKVPAVENLRLSLYVRFSADTETVTAMQTTMVGGAHLERFSVSRDGGLADSEILIEGLTGLSTDVLVRIERLDGTTEVARLAAANPSFIVQGSLTRFQVAQTYTFFGIEHILEGMDHLLFIACLIFIARTPRRILVTITGFTAAHSVTLTLAALNLVRLPIPPIEATIALSIVFLAREIALDRRDTLTWRYPIAVSASFGLLHGFGFASALSEIGLPQTEIPTALFAFNIGVEIGQLLFVLAILSIAWVATHLLRLLVPKSSGVDGGDAVLTLVHAIEKPAAYLVGSITIVWTVQRTAGFFTY